MAQLPTPYLSPIKSQKNGDEVLTKGCQPNLGQNKEGLQYGQLLPDKK